MPKNHNIYEFDLKGNLQIIKEVLQKIAKEDDFDTKKFQKIIKKHPRIDGGILSKFQLLEGYKYLHQHFPNEFLENLELIKRIQTKPIRTQSGVTTITVLTKPFACPGKCIFCPNDVRMPKSYIQDEPGAQRAARNKFDPYLQTFRRLEALRSIGHEVEKVELIILGGTWSFYPEAYQIWFIKRCFQALNDFSFDKDQTENIEAQIENWNYLQKASLENIRNQNFKNTSSKDPKDISYNQKIAELYKDSNDQETSKKQKATWEELYLEQKINESARSRSVGLVIETRPDKISEEEVVRIRKLGCTKTQIGVQSLQDEVLKLNHRGHTVAETRKAFALLRQAGFKIHAHWMPNLYGSNPAKDIEDYQKLFLDEDFRPDELKIYPCSLIETAELMDYYKQGLWKPYTHQELLDVVVTCLTNTEEYCRLTRVIRDIPSTDIVVGNKITNFRQLAELEAKKKGLKLKDIRAREIRGKQVLESDLELKVRIYQTSVSSEYFLEYVTQENQIAGFLRLSLPKYVNGKHPFLEELDYSSIIREVHVYGQSLAIGQTQTGLAQHLGLGTKLIAKAKEISQEFGYKKMSVISAIGTREYYIKKGFEIGKLYPFMSL
jgi:elongator complex protein 3